MPVSNVLVMSKSSVSGYSIHFSRLVPILPVPTALYTYSRTPPPIRLEGKAYRYACHNYIQSCADINRNRGPCVAVRRDNGADDTHDTVPRNSKSVACATVCRRKYFRRVSIQRAVVDVEAEVDDTSKGRILCLRADLSLVSLNNSLNPGMLIKIKETYLRIRKEENTGNQGPYHHRVLTTQHPQIAHPACQYRAPDTREVDQRIVPPGHICTRLSKLRTPTLQILRQEDVVERIRQPDQHPARPDQPRAHPDPLRSKQASKMDPDFRQRPLTAVSLLTDGAARSHLLEGKRTRAVVFLRDELQCFDGLCVAAFADEELGRFAEAHDGDAEDGHDEDEGSGGVPDVAPSLIVGIGAGFGVGEERWVLAREVGNEGPGEEAGDELADTWVWG